MLKALDLLLPVRCVHCGRGERLLCAACRASIRMLDRPLCARCGTPTAWPVERCAECSGRRLPFRTARAAVAYEGPARMLVAGWKERGLRAVAVEAAGLVAAVVPRPRADAIAFVPGDRERTLWRGHTTAEQLARVLGELWGLEVVAALERSGRAPRQRGLSRTDRRANVRGSFRCVRAPPKTVVLVDDVYTTGATVSAAATELKRAGARTVDVVTFARTIRGR